MRAWSARAMVAALAALAAAEVSAVRHTGFEMDAFNKAYPASNRGTFVFSPVSFEVDCVLVAESLDVIPKADISSMIYGPAGMSAEAKAKRDVRRRVPGRYQSGQCL